jgi:predicted aspartyl protease
VLKLEQAMAEVELRHKGRVVRLRALVDTGASTSVISKGLAEELGSFIPLEGPYELRTADEKGKVRVVGRCMVGVVFQGAEVPGGAVFEVAENLRRGIELTIGRPEIDRWDIVFTPEGVRPRKVPIEFEII